MMFFWPDDVLTRDSPVQQTNQPTYEDWRIKLTLAHIINNHYRWLCESKKQNQKTFLSKAFNYELEQWVADNLDHAIID